MNSTNKGIHVDHKSLLVVDRMKAARKLRKWGVAKEKLAGLNLSHIKRLFAAMVTATSCLDCGGVVDYEGCWCHDYALEFGVNG
jgi:hypothetical protein